MTPADTELAEKLLRLLAHENFAALGASPVERRWTVCYDHLGHFRSSVTEDTLAAAVDAALERVGGREKT